MVERTSLVARLLDCDSPLVVLSGYAGAGKTTVLVQWTRSDPRPHAWLQLERAHNDPLALVDDLASVLSRVAVMDPNVHRWTHLSSPPLRERILPSLRGSLAESSPFLLILDDAHVVEAKRSWDIIQTLLDVLPAGAQLAIGTRAAPALPLARTEAAGHLFELGGHELAFSLEETKELLTLYGLDADETIVAALQEVTEGWPAGISLATLACKPDCTTEWVASIDGRQRCIARYLTSEVLERQRPSVRRFLLETSILSRLSDGCCRAVTGRTDSGRLLARLSQENVFIVPLDEKQEWFRYHHLFADLLEAELERRDGSRVSELHSRAAIWSEDNGDLEGAVRHWLAAGEVERAGDVVCLGHLIHSGQGRVDTIARWLELFSPQRLRSYAPIALVAGLVAAMMRGSRHEWVDISLTVPTDDTPIRHANVTRRAWQTMNRAYVAAEGASAMLRDAESAVELGVGSHPAWTAAANICLGGARWLNGDDDGAERAFCQAIEDGQHVNVNARVAAMGYLSLLMADQGRWERAESEAIRAKECFEESELGLQAPLLNVPLAEVRILAHRGASVTSDALDTIGQDLADFQLPVWIDLIVTVNLAFVALDLGDLVLADQWSTRASSILKDWPDAGVFAERVGRLQRMLLERRHVATLTPAEERVLELLATHLKLPEIARRLVVSQNTVKTHVRDLYRKLDAHSRTSAVERARKLNLLRD